MAPNISKSEIFLECTKNVNKYHSKNDLPPREYKLVWRNIFLYILLHISALYGLYLIFTSAKLLTSIFAVFLHNLGALGVTSGAHRLWSHRAYKAKLPLRILLVVLQTLAFQDSVIDWCRYHRVHHKYTETDADPHNAKRGFFFSHVGWLLCRLHPDKKHYNILTSFVCFIIPTIMPVYFWGETYYTAWYVNLFRYTLTLNVTWLVNSAAHFFGQKPYDKNIYATENLSVSILAIGEGWHNYHHTFPWDYKTSELGKYSTNFTTAFIDLMAKIGWAYDLKSVSEEMVKNRTRRTGDGTHAAWRWNDKDQSIEEKHSVDLFTEL